MAAASGAQGWPAVIYGRPLGQPRRRPTMAALRRSGWTLGDGSAAIVGPSGGQVRAPPAGRARLRLPAARWGRNSGQADDASARVRELGGLDWAPTPLARLAAAPAPTSASNNRLMGELLRLKTRLC